MEMPDFKPRKIAADVEGCVTPGVRSPYNLEGMAEIKTYNKMANEFYEKYGEEVFPSLFFVTGRPGSYMEGVIQAVGAMGPAFEMPSVVENGAAYWSHNERQIKKFHPLVEDRKEDLKGVSKFVDELMGRYKMVKESGKEVCISLNPLEMRVDGLYKNIVEEFKKENLYDIVDVTHSASAVDITPKGVTKLSGLKHLLCEYDINPKDVLGVGDSKGDVEWLNYVGKAAAPLNATVDLREGVRDLWVADWEDAKGFSHVLQHFVVKHKKINLS